MSVCGRYRAVFLIIALCGCAAAQLEDMEISGFRVPEYDEQGQMVYQLFGDYAVLGSDGIVKVDGVRVEFYREGDVFMEVASPHCFYSQKTREVNSDAPVHADMKGAELTGTGYVLSTDARTVRVLNDSRVVFQDVAKLSGQAAVTTNETVITSRELFLDYTGRSARFIDSVQIQNQETFLRCSQLDVFLNEDNEIARALAKSSVSIASEDMMMSCGELEAFFTENNEMERAVAESGVVISNAEWQVSSDNGVLMYIEHTAVLTGNVQAKNKDLDLLCSTLNLRFDENNEIDWIEALGDVRLLNEAREAYAGRAVFDVATDEFLLEDNPKLVEGKNMLLADTIRFWRGDRRMVCEPAARVVFYPDSEFKTELFEK